MERPRDSTFDALCGALRVKWQLPYDTFYPFGNCRGAGIETVWTFDVDNDVLLFSKRDCGGRLALPLVRQLPITLDDFEPLEPPRQPALSLGDDSMLTPPYWKPKLHVPKRNKLFSSVYKRFGLPMATHPSESIQRPHLPQTGPRRHSNSNSRL